MFKEEFDGIPYPVRKALESRLEDIVRMIYGRYNASTRDYSVVNYTNEQISAMIFSVLDLANRMKTQDFVDND